MVGGGLAKAESTVKLNSEIFNPKINFTNNKVQKVIPEKNTILTDDGKEYTYDQLVVATGINPDFSAIKGLKEALDDPSCPVGSIYWKDYATKFNDLAEKFKGGKAVFTEP